MVLEPEKKKNNNKKAKMKGGLGWIRGQEQDMSSLHVMGTIFLVYITYLTCSLYIFLLHIV